MNIPWVERKGFSHWGMSLLWLIVVFVMSQVVVAIVSVAILYATGEATTTQELMTALQNRLDILFIGNSVGQIFILGLATFLVVGLHTGKETKRQFLRITWKDDTVFYMIVGGILILAIQPTVMFLGYLNSFLPTPDFLEELHRGQYEMFEEYLTSDGVLLIGLFHVALVPAFAEEVLFRGYVMRAFERSSGIIAALVLSSFIFAAFHLQLTNLLPLATLGATMGLLAWLSGSIWPAAVAHFVNNGSAVVMATYMPEQAFADMTPETLPPLWMLALSIVISGILVKILYEKSNYRLKS
ncbi:CPBP family intramembrane glutamic endopeptidase [Rhodohalobacter sp. 8-1]|uniref:CPBP family intramembrane glutamic endopeptidase n=1 Tax=Rhodohalobacter sp. 8-1 TaxID=3131972 RepID=UPI0030EC753F